MQYTSYLASGETTSVDVLIVFVGHEVLDEGRRVGDALEDAVHVACVAKVSEKHKNIILGLGVTNLFLKLGHLQ